MNSTKDAHEL